jgi:hypothetical protein
MIVRYVLVLRGTQKGQGSEERARLITALCQQHGMSPFPVDLAALLQKVIRGATTVFENSYQSRDAALWAADMWTPVGKEWDGFSMLVFKVSGVNIPSTSVTRKGATRNPTGLNEQPFLLESIDFDNRFTVTAADRRDAVMLLDQGMMQWLLDCDQVSFHIMGDTVQSVVKRSAEPKNQPGLEPRWHRADHPDTPFTNPRRVEPVELELLFKFHDGFLARVPQLLRTDFTARTP